MLNWGHGLFFFFESLHGTVDRAGERNSNRVAGEYPRDWRQPPDHASPCTQCFPTADKARSGSHNQPPRLTSTARSWVQRQSKGTNQRVNRAGHLISRHNDKRLSPSTPASAEIYLQTSSSSGPIIGAPAINRADQNWAGRHARPDATNPVPLGFWSADPSNQHMTSARFHIHRPVCHSATSPSYPPRHLKQTVTLSAVNHARHRQLGQAGCPLAAHQVLAPLNHWILATTPAIVHSPNSRIRSDLRKPAENPSR